jgi:CubicO group peptidase (beta-lactamase class C family)
MKLKFTRLKKIIIATFLVTLISYDPVAREKGEALRGKLFPENVRITNTSYTGKEFTSFEKKVRTFMHKWNIEGASVAVAKDGKLVYSRGFGYADKEDLIPAQPYNRFRIASVSKLITAVAIMKLQEDGKLSVYDKVFGPEGILSDSIYCQPRDKRVFKITLAHLLSHEGGWTTRWGDQMFMPWVVADKMDVIPPADTRTILLFALNKNLHFTPGKGRSYSNLGYAILGLVIEKVSGMPYEEYCRKEVLEPLGIYDIKLARNLKEEKAPFEVSYYEPGDAIAKHSIYNKEVMVPASYGGNDIEALGGAGAWIATAPDLMRLLLAVDGFNTKKDLLSTESLDFMTDTRNGYAPVGWKGTIYNGTWWRTGSFPGTACMIKRQPDGVAWVVLLNTSAWNGPEISTDINIMMARGLATIHTWPERDLFSFSVPVPLVDELPD